MSCFNWILSCCRPRTPEYRSRKSKRDQNLQVYEENISRHRGGKSSSDVLFSMEKKEHFITRDSPARTPLLPRCRRKGVDLDKPTTSNNIIHFREKTAKMSIVVMRRKIDPSPTVRTPLLLKGEEGGGEVYHVVYTRKTTISTNRSSFHSRANRHQERKSSLKEEISRDPLLQCCIPLLCPRYCRCYFVVHCHGMFTKISFRLKKSYRS